MTRYIYITNCNLDTTLDTDQSSCLVLATMKRQKTILAYILLGLVYVSILAILIKLEIKSFDF